MASKFRILFVCTGNICRSPTGEGIMRRLVADSRLAEAIHVESAGTMNYHVGDLADPRTREAAARRGYRLDSRARQVVDADLDTFDVILAADSDNMERLRRRVRNEAQRAKLAMMLDWHPERRGQDVPDPYYGGADGFELVIDLLEKSCDGLLADVKTRLGPKSQTG